MNEINSYEDVQQYIHQIKQQECYNEQESQEKMEIKEEEMEIDQSNIENENEKILQEMQEIKENKRNVKELCELLQKSEMKKITEEWNNEGIRLHEMLKEAIKEEMKTALIWWNNHSDEERRAVLMLSVHALLDDGMETGESLLLADVFPDINYLSEHPQTVMKFISNICKNPRYCNSEIFNFEELKEIFEKEVGSVMALSCITTMLDARVCIACKLCINILIITNQIDY
ncbi:hypothetical protein ENUP19_0163G0018 [Entamoeba nuttalli]|uniref:Uncharacterized protein n=2 Tax=Entamoeba nuttalli TaxID=412467 RepID=K2H458_ENTNP|nr:hypothetical protein ENU1_024670 [Entamoeba nuttalli P19]EKE42328.1 hypothetical protein ENU1_024670 [Entamoeba nuttalli P19]|eukprot:XP_008855335.1 hypothetical protein ENU1_024670 [Entamoeba nuttalli P19]